MYSDEETGLLVELRAHQRRVAILKEQAAINGRTTDPAILIEIEDITTKIEEIEKKLKSNFAHQLAAKSENPSWKNKQDEGLQVLVASVYRLRNIIRSLSETNWEPDLKKEDIDNFFFYQKEFEDAMYRYRVLIPILIFSSLHDVGHIVRTVDLFVSDYSRGRLKEHYLKSINTIMKEKFMRIDEIYKRVVVDVQEYMGISQQY